MVGTNLNPAFRDGLLEGQVALITGGGTGIGLATARLMGLLGAKVAICGRRSDPLEGAQASLEKEGIEAHAGPCDIRETEQISAFLDAVLERFGRVSILVNNAGGQFPSPAEHVSPKGFAAVVANNLNGTWAMIHAVANRCMLPAKEGAIVNVVAQMKRGFPGMVHTGAARAGVANMTMTLGVEWARRGLRVNSIAPGVIATEGVKQYPPEILDRAIRATPMKRLGTSEEVATLITYLASDLAAFVTGQCWWIDGGQSLWGDIWDLSELD